MRSPVPANESDRPRCLMPVLRKPRIPTTPDYGGCTFHANPLNTLHTDNARLWRQHKSGLKDYETVAWGGVVAPRGTPAPVVDKINAALQAALQAPDVRKGLAALGAEPAGGSPAQFRKLIDAETAKWRALIKSAQIEQLD
ncbi:hypothetical protein JJQ59_09550 [Cupriavidus necator]|uniref:Extra-cytoplasmic solute receptor n=1 Tax=Cupriavidus necator TaxID=106590 RepID=A0A367PKL5_CUPNE|nr:hypothetical protein JJQ59_09550 [Cupriavidus necator]RCJ07556.1 hypothetical protein DDK22_16245 [Cupriavidus necator]